MTGFYNTETAGKTLGVGYYRVWRAANEIGAGFMVGRRRFFSGEDLVKIANYINNIKRSPKKGVTK